MFIRCDNRGQTAVTRVNVNNIVRLEEIKVYDQHRDKVLNRYTRIYTVDGQYFESILYMEDVMTLIENVMDKFNNER